MAGHRPNEQHPHDSPQLALYKRFMTAATRGDTEAALDCVDLDAFEAILPDQGRLVFTQFVEYLDRLRSIAPDFGQDVTIIEVLEREALMAVLYLSTFTLSLHPHEPIQYPSTDWVTFHNGRIVALRVLYDRADTRQQAFGTLLPPEH